MKIRHIVLPLLLAAAAPALSKPDAPGHIPSSPDLGKAEGQCRPDEKGPALTITVTGLKDRKGNMRAEVYPAREGDFLADDNVLVMAGKTFRRVEIPVPQSGPVQLCIRVPGPGNYGLLVLHDRDMNRKFGLSVDGAGFSNNPKIGLGKPRAASTAFVAGPGITPMTIRLNYRRGLFSFAPLKQD